MFNRIKDFVQYYRTGSTVNDVDWTKASACYSQWRVKEIKEEYAEMRDFLKHNPRYRYPGQSNNKCYGSFLGSVQKLRCFALDLLNLTRRLGLSL